MTTAQDEAESLLQEVMPFAEHMLKERGEFFPFAGALTPKGEFLPIVGYESLGQAPDELIDLLSGRLREGAVAGEYAATALVYNARVTPPRASDEIDAISAELEHRDGYAATLFFPYALNDDEAELPEPFGTSQSRGIFPRLFVAQT